MTLVANDNEFWMKEKINKIRFHLLIYQYVLSLVIRMRLFWWTREQIMCCHVSQLLIIKNISLLFWNNPRRLFLYLDGLDCDTWCNKNLSCGILIEFVQIQFKSIFRYVGWTKYLPTYIPTYPSKLNTYLDKNLFTYQGQIFI
jgi:hypothetical protein